MTMLITLEQAKQHLRIVDLGTAGNPDDPDLILKIEGASESVLDYVRSSDPDWLDTAGVPILDTAGDPVGIPANVKNATLLLLGYLYREREGDNTVDIEHGFLPRAVLSMLYPYRLPTLA